MRQEDLERIFSYIAGIIKGLEGMPIQIGGVNDHIHIFDLYAQNNVVSGICAIHQNQKQ